MITSQPIIQPRRIHGRRVIRLRNERQTAMAAMAGHIIQLDGVAPAGLSPKDISATAPKHVHLEIGFGTGEHLAHLAAQHPQDLFLAAESYTAGVGHIMKLAHQGGLSNIHVYPDDGFALMQALQTHSVDHAYLLFPDPWPKNRHQKRRFVQDMTLNEFARIIRPGGTLLLASDDEQMVDWMLSHMLPRRDFHWEAKNAGDWRVPLPGHIHSRYAEKALAAGKPLYYLCFTRQ